MAQLRLSNRSKLIRLRKSRDAIGASLLNAGMFTENAPPV
jgi:hypothetical protein